MTGCRLLVVFTAMALASACAPGADPDAADRVDDAAGAVEAAASVADPFRGRTIRWSWNDGLPDGGRTDVRPTHEHTFHEDGSVTWRVIGGPQAGHAGTESSYAAMRVNDDVYAISYLASSGYTLTAVLDLRGGTMVGFASGPGEWHPGHGTFEFVD